MGLLSGLGAGDLRALPPPAQVPAWCLNATMPSSRKAGAALADTFHHSTRMH